MPDQTRNLSSIIGAAFAKGAGKRPKKNDPIVSDADREKDLRGKLGNALGNGLDAQAKLDEQTEAIEDLKSKMALLHTLFDGFKTSFDSLEQNALLESDICAPFNHQLEDLNEQLKQVDAKVEVAAMSGLEAGKALSQEQADLEVVLTDLDVDLEALDKEKELQEQERNQRLRKNLQKAIAEKEDLAAQYDALAMSLEGMSANADSKAKPIFEYNARNFKLIAADLRKEAAQLKDDLANL